MATAIKKLHDDFLSCIICTDLYNDPCTLLCGHTFCRGCLAKFTKTRQDAIKAKSILCPNCRHMTRVPNPNRQVEDWVKQIKPSLLIQGLLDSFASQGGAEIAIENQCFSCLQHDEKTQASSNCTDCDITLCHKCVKSHLAIPAIQHHVISDLAGNVKVRKKRKLICKSHNVIIEFCCKDCHKAVCQKCCTLDHRKCDNVVTIESMVPEMKSVIRKIKDTVMQQIKQTRSNLLNSRSKMKQNETQKANVLAEIRKESQRAINIVKQKEKELVDKVEDCTEKQNRELNAWMKKVEIAIQMYQQQCEFIDQALTAESEMDMYEMYQMCQSGAVGLVAQSDGEQTHDSTGFVVTFDRSYDEQKKSSYLQLGTIKLLKEEFEPNCTPTLMDTIDIRIKTDHKTPDRTDVVTFGRSYNEQKICRDPQLGTIKPLKEEFKPNCTATLIDTIDIRTKTDHKTPDLTDVVRFDRRFYEQKMSRDPQLGIITLLKEKIDPSYTQIVMDTNDIKTETDRKTPDLTDVTVVDVYGIETVVVTDDNNDCLMSFYTKDGRTCHNLLRLRSRPLSVTRLYHNQVVVSFESHNEIVIVKVTPDLVLLSNITTRKKYHCLTALTESTLVAGSCIPSSLDIIDLSGRVHRSIIPGRNLIHEPLFLSTTNKGNIIVSDHGENSVFCLTPKGEVVFHYTPTKYRAPLGITTSTTGDILVAEYDKSKVLQLSSTGRFVREILTSQDGIDRPCGIFLHNHKLYVTQKCQLKVFKVNI